MDFDDVLKDQDFLIRNGHSQIDYNNETDEISLLNMATMTFGIQHLQQHLDFMTIGCSKSFEEIVAYEEEPSASRKLIEEGINNNA